MRKACGLMRMTSHRSGQIVSYKEADNPGGTARQDYSLARENEQQRYGVPKLPSVAAVALAIAIAVSGCGSNGSTPAGPTPVNPVKPEVPHVAGAYSGSISAWFGETALGTYQSTLTVTQVDNRVEIQGDVDGGRVIIETTSGTIEPDGRVTSTGPLKDSPTCGARERVSEDVRFVGDRLELAETWDSAECERARFEGEWTRN